MASTVQQEKGDRRSDDQSRLSGELGPLGPHLAGQFDPSLATLRVGAPLNEKVTLGK